MKKLVLLYFIPFLLIGCGRKSADEKRIEKAAPEPPAVVAGDDVADEKEIVEERAFQTAFAAIRELRDKGEFGEAIKMCRETMSELQVAEHVEAIGESMQKLVAMQNEALELSFAIESLLSDDEKTVDIASRKLKESGETGKILLSKAVRDGDADLVAAAGSILAELDESELASPVFLERLRTYPSREVSEAIVTILTGAGKAMDYGAVPEVFFDTFEGYSNGAPLSSGFNGWNLSHDACRIENSVASPFVPPGSTRSLALLEDAILSKRFCAPGSVTSLWLRLDLRPVHYKEIDNVRFDPDAAMMFYLNTNGHYVTSDDGVWRTNSVSPVSGKPAVSNAENDFVRIHLHINYVNQRYDMF